VATLKGTRLKRFQALGSGGASLSDAGQRGAVVNVVL
jgi:hypothetical protein